MKWDDDFNDQASSSPLPEPLNEPVELELEPEPEPELEPKPKAAEPLSEQAAGQIDEQISVFPDPGFNLEVYLDSLRRAFIVEALSRSKRNVRYAAVLLRLKTESLKRLIRDYEIDLNQIT